MPCRRFRSTRRIINGHMLARIRAVAQREYEGIVYDLDVTQDDTFAALFVLVHNCDPPYIPDTRRAGSYGHDMSLEDHRDLVRLLLGLEGMAILSGYRHPVYAPLEEAGWERLDFPVACHAAGRTRASGLRGEGACLERQRRVESVWLSPRARAAAGRGRQLDLRDLEAACEIAETIIL